VAREGLAELNAMIARLRGLPAALRASGPEVATAVRAELAASVAAQQAPDGTPWPLTESGDAALLGAMKGVTVNYVGRSIVVRVTGIEAKHHLGAVKGGKKRPIIPTRGMPETFTRAITKVLAAKYVKAMQ